MLVRSYWLRVWHNNDIENPDSYEFWIKFSPHKVDVAVASAWIDSDRELLIHFQRLGGWPYQVQACSVLSASLYACCYIFRLLLCLPYADYHWDCIVSLSKSIHKGIVSHPVWLHLGSALSLYDMISLWPLVRYNLLQVWLSLVDAHLPLHSPAYLVQYDNKYLNCTSKTLGP